MTPDLVDVEPEDGDAYVAANAAMKERFRQWASANGLEMDPEAIESPLHYKHHYIDGHLTRWTCADLDELYLELYPAKVVVDEGDLGEVLEEGRAFLRFLAGSDLLAEGSDSPDALAAHLSGIEEAFRRNMEDPSLQSFGKRIWSQAAAEGVDFSDKAAMDAFIARFNARPLAERDAVLGPNLSPRLPRDLFHGAQSDASGGMAPTGLPFARGGRFTPPGTPSRPASKRRKRRR